MTADKHNIRAGMNVLCLDASGDWLPMVAETRMEGIHNARGERIHDFEVIWVRLREPNAPRIPWPATHVKFATAPTIRGSQREEGMA